MASQNVPSPLWDYGLVYKAEILSWMPPAGSDCTGYEILMGEMPNITEWLDSPSTTLSGTMCPRTAPPLNPADLVDGLVYHTAWAVPSATGY